MAILTVWTPRMKLIVVCDFVRHTRYYASVKILLYKIDTDRCLALLVTANDNETSVHSIYIHVV